MLASGAVPLDAVYPITVPGDDAGSGHVRLAWEFLGAGIRFFQVRDKSTADRELFRRLREVKNLCSRSGARFVVNDRVDLALATQADGVHLGQDDLPVHEARAILGPEAIIGLSTHSREQFEAALQTSADYVALGPIFESRTKKSSYKPLGLALLRELASSTNRPVVAIGGIDLEAAKSVWDAGAMAVAVISDVATASHPCRRAAAYLLLKKATGS